MDKERLQEQERVEQVKQVINKALHKQEKNVQGLKGDVIDLRKNFFEDVTVNLDEPDDVIETFQSIKQQAEFLSERERSHKLGFDQVKTLQRLKSSPYFGRIDFREDGEEKEEQIYLGISSLMDEKEEEFLIYDWRAPISSLYYDYTPGPAKFESPVDTIEGEITLKRQFIIRDGEIQAMFDTGVTIGDELLQSVLGNNANTQMKSIVATIQKEQNQIIRNEKNKYLIVQGVAGGGKTSAALQRVAYLLYRYRETLNSDQIILFSPNPLFNSYVATVLPELGEENMQQTTFQDYLKIRLDKEFDIEDVFSQMEYLLTHTSHPLYEAKVTGIKYKATLQFKNQLDKYVSELGDTGLLFKNISFRGNVLIEANEIKKHFYSLERTLSIPNRIKLVGEWLLQELKQLERIERKKEWVVEESQLLDKGDFLNAYQAVQEEFPYNEDSFDDFQREQDWIYSKIVKDYFKPLRVAVKKLMFVNIKQIYREFFKKYRESNSFSKEWDKICEYTIENLNENHLAYEDATPYLYLENLIKGKKVNTMIKHLFIDEAQDYSPFQFALLQQIYPNARMTILGDFNQAIFMHTQDASSILTDGIVTEEDAQWMTLTRSYRSTRQIVEFTKHLLPNGDLIEPFNREGTKPTLIKNTNKTMLQQQLISQLKELKIKGHQTIAVICKTEMETNEAYQTLSNYLEVKKMTKETSSYEKGILILPAYLAKGIEFDAVIIYDASKEVYEKESERKLFYTACTRAMHALYLFFIKEKSPFIEQVPHSFYQLEGIIE